MEQTWAPGGYPIDGFAYSLGLLRAKDEGKISLHLKIRICRERCCPADIYSRVGIGNISSFGDYMTADERTVSVAYSCALRLL
jgi:hypothetical protein